MPLSEQEQRLLEEMERSLYQNDADFVATVPGRVGRPNYTVVIVAVLIAFVGIAALVTGVVVRQPLVGVLGFAVMFAGVLLAVTPPRRAMSAPPAARSSKTSTGGFMQKLNDRWDKRQDDRGQ